MSYGLLFTHPGYTFHQSKMLEMVDRNDAVSDVISRLCDNLSLEKNKEIYFYNDHGKLILLSDTDNLENFIKNTNIKKKLFHLHFMKHANPKFIAGTSVFIISDKIEEKMQETPLGTFALLSEQDKCAQLKIAASQLKKINSPEEKPEINEEKIENNTEINDGGKTIEVTEIKEDEKAELSDIAPNELSSCDASDCLTCHEDEDESCNVISSEIKETKIEECTPDDKEQKIEEPEIEEYPGYKNEGCSDCDEDYTDDSGYDEEQKVNEHTDKLIDGLDTKLNYTKEEECPGCENEDCSDCYEDCTDDSDEEPENLDEEQKVNEQPEDYSDITYSEYDYTGSIEQPFFMACVMMFVLMIISYAMTTAMPKLLS